MEFLPWNEVANERNTLGPSEQKNLPNAKQQAAILAAFFIRLSATKLDPRRSQSASGGP
jgi:hypothetical protein